MSPGVFSTVPLSLKGVSMCFSMFGFRLVPVTALHRETIPEL